MGFFSIYCKQENICPCFIFAIFAPLTSGQIEDCRQFFFSFFLNKNTIVNLRQGDNIMLKVKNTGKIISVYTVLNQCVP